MPVTVRLNSIYSASLKYTKNPSWAFFAKFDQFLLIVLYLNYYFILYVYILCYYYYLFIQS